MFFGTAVSSNRTRSTSKKVEGVTPKARQFTEVLMSQLLLAAPVQKSPLGPSSSTRSIEALATLLEMYPTVLAVGTLPSTKLKPAPSMKPAYLITVNCAG